MYTMVDFFKLPRGDYFMTKVTYIRCPRCELNYITKDEKYCSVCKQEMQVGGGEVDESELELCPICKTNYIQPDEIMCPSCYADRLNDPNYDGEEDAEWSQYINRDEDDEMGDSDSEELGDMSSVKDLGLDDDDDDLDDGLLPDDDLDGIVDDEDLSEEFDSDSDDDFDDYEDDDDYEDYDDEDDDE